MPPLKGNMALHITDAGTFRSCRLRWHFSSMTRLNLEAMAPPRALWMGIGIHEALAAYYGTGEDAPDAYENWCHNSIGKITKEYPGLDEERLTAFDDDLELGVGMLQHYVHWVTSGGHDNWEVIAVEDKIEIPDFIKLDTPIEVSNGQSTEQLHTLPLKGRGDMLVRSLEDRRYWVVEHKTALQIDTGRLILEEQPTVYQHTMGKKYDVEIAGVLFNFLRKKIPSIPKLLVSGEGLSKAKNIDTTSEVYRGCIREHGFNEEDYTDILDILDEKGNTFFLREAVVRSQAETTNVMDRLKMVGNDMFNDPVIYPAPEPMKCRMCPFQAPCIALNDGSDWKHILQQQYIIRHPQEPVGEDLHSPELVL